MQVTTKVVLVGSVGRKCRQYYQVHVRRILSGHADTTPAVLLAVWAGGEASRVCAASDIAVVHLAYPYPM